MAAHISYLAVKTAVCVAAHGLILTESLVHQAAIATPLMRKETLGDLELPLT